MGNEMENAFQSIQMQHQAHPQWQFPNVQTVRTVWHSSLRGLSRKVSRCHHHVGVLTWTISRRSQATL